MKKNIKKIFLALFLFFVFVFKTFALEVELKEDTNKVGVGDIFNVYFNIISDGKENIEISSIKNIENFKIIGQSQSQSSSSQVVIINGNAKQKTTINYDLKLTLQALKEGTFEIGPAIIKQNGKEIKSNSIKIHVGKGSTLNNNLLNTNNSNTNNISQNNNLNQNNFGNNPSKKQNIKELQDLQNYKTSNNNKSLYLLLIVLIGLGILAYLQISGKINLLKKENSGEEEQYKNNKNKFEENDNKEEEIDFDQNLENIDYPEIGDKNFLEKITKILKTKLENKYKIKNIESKGLKEILEEIDKPSENVEKLVDLIIKAKYSNNVENFGEILNLTKEI